MLRCLLEAPVLLQRPYEVLWVVLIVVGILIWNFSTNFQQRDTPIPFSQFVETLDKGDIDTATIEGNNGYGTTRQGTKYRTYAPPQYEQQRPSPPIPAQMTP